MSKRFIAILLLCVAVFVSLFVLARKDDAAAPENNQQVTATNHSQGGGNEDAVSLLEYGDFECPGCGGYYPVLKEVKAKYGDKLNFQFRHFPIVSIHPNAMAAHRAAEAAGKQGKFWEMHDLLYERQTIWRQSQSASSVFAGYAGELGLDTEKFATDVAAASTKDTIDADIEEGKKIDVQGTPTFVFEGKKLDNPPRDVEGFSKLIDEALAAKQAE